MYNAVVIFPMANSYTAEELWMRTTYWQSALMLMPLSSSGYIPPPSSYTSLAIFPHSTTSIGSSLYIATICQRKTWSDHDDAIKWKHFPRYWPFVRGIHQSPVNSPHKGQWRGALMFPLISTWINGWVNNRDTGYLRRLRAHYDVTIMSYKVCGHLQFFHQWHFRIAPRTTTIKLSDVNRQSLSSGPYKIFTDKAYKFIHL